MNESITLDELQKEIPDVGSEDLGSLRNTGTFKYYATMRSQIRVGTCPFCIVDTSLNKILYENEYWMIWENPVGKKDPALEKHYVIPFKGVHITNWTVLNAEQKSAFMDIVLGAIKNFKIPGGALIARFGEIARNAGSIRHIHGNIKVPTGKLRYTETLAKDEDDLNRKGPVLLIWEKMYQLQLKGIEKPEDHLTDEEKAILASRK